MKYFARLLISSFIIFDVILIGWILLHNYNFAVLNPEGIIAVQERQLMFIALIMMSIVIVPVFIFAIFVAIKYRESNSEAKYLPEWDHNHGIQIFWWAFTIFMVSTMGFINWNYTHRLDPSQSIASINQPLTVQVIALRWKWLFVYPKLGIASLNLLEIPEKTPVQFELTADQSPMTSFWIPQLGGQIYAMSGMSTQTHLMANTTGQFYGTDTEINGKGFSEMKFITISVSQTEFNKWVYNVKQNSIELNRSVFNQLTQPTENVSPITYSSPVNNLFTSVIMNYMAPTSYPHMKPNNSMQDMQM